MIGNTDATPTQLNDAHYDDANETNKRRRTRRLSVCDPRRKTTHNQKKLSDTKEPRSRQQNQPQDQ
eukprot:12911638-Prorocentrum_lima.AAC.1